MPIVRESPAEREVGRRAEFAPQSSLILTPRLPFASAGGRL